MEHRIDDYQEILEKHNDYFRTGATRNLDFKLRQLRNLKQAMEARERELLEALWLDLHKSSYEAFTTEIGIVYSSINHYLKNLKKWVKPSRVSAPLMLFGTKNRIMREPYGTVLIIGPFNYPVNLVIEPLIGAIAAGNCAVIKTSNMAPNVSDVVCSIISDAFDDNYISTVRGNRETTSALLDLPFDYIFFTGGENTGKIVMKAAAEHLIPVTLELGGKSPCIIDETADIETAARKITWGKFSNAGQTCVAPDYLVVHENVKQPLIDNIKKYLVRFYGTDPSASNDFGRIINTSHTERLAGIIEPDKVITGGDSDIENRYIAPTLIDSDWDAPAMKEEIFGPVLPVIGYTDIDPVIEKIGKRPKPLALYVFTKNVQVTKKVLGTLSFGGGCVNDVLMHVSNPHLPFGGVGASGIGSYHGKRTYETFSHEKGVMHRIVNMDPDVMYPPYTDKKLSLIRRVLG